VAYFSVFRHAFAGADENHDEPQDSLHSGSEFSQAPTEHKSKMLWLQPACSVSWYRHGFTTIWERGLFGRS